MTFKAIFGYLFCNKAWTFEIVLMRIYLNYPMLQKGGGACNSRKCRSRKANLKLLVGRDGSWMGDSLRYMW